MDTLNNSLNKAQAVLISLFEACHEIDISDIETNLSVINDYLCDAIESTSKSENKIGACKVSDSGCIDKVLEVDCMLGQIRSVLSCVLEDVTDSHMAGLLGGAITITNTAQETLKS